MPEYHNPQQEPGMERRLLLAFALVFLILLAAQPLLIKYARKAPEPGPAPQPAQTAPQPQAAAPPAVSPEKPVEGTRQASAESDVVIENDLYRITLTNRGAQAKSWILKNYTDENGKPLELVNPLGAEKSGLPLSLWLYDEGLRNKVNSALYVTSATGTQRAPSEITFEYADGDVSVRKVLRFDHSYVVKVESEMARGGSVVQAYPAWPSGFGDMTGAVSYAAQRIDYQPGEKVTRLSADRKGEKIAGGGTIRGPFYWAGTLDQYFAAVFLPEQPENAAMVTLRNAINIPKEQKPVEVLGVAVGSVSGVTRERIFVGPKGLDVLEAIKASPLRGQQDAPNLGGLVDFGFFGIIAKPLFLWLHWTYEHWVHNWGWSIIILTVIINVALLPLRITSMKSALKMQKVQPQVNAIKKKYEKVPMRDPRRTEMNQEIAALFKREKVNPAGGCLPMVIQLPFLFAFYTMLGVAIELRHAPWLWIHDLSSPDRLYVLPVLIVVTTVLVQKMTPTAGMDPAQQKMMTIFMPVMLGFISWSLAAGLSVYWVTGNIIGIIQQYLMNRSAMGREMQAEADKRARKRELKARG